MSTAHRCLTKSFFLCSSRNGGSVRISNLFEVTKLLSAIQEFKLRSDEFPSITNLDDEMPSQSSSGTSVSFDLEQMTWFLSYQLKGWTRWPQSSWSALMFCASKASPVPLQPVEKPFIVENVSAFICPVHALSCMSSDASKFPRYIWYCLLKPRKYAATGTRK